MAEYHDFSNATEEQSLPNLHSLPLHTAKDILNLAGSFWQCQTLLAAFELDIFTALSEKKTAEQLAEELDLNPRAVSRLLCALCAMKLLIKEENFFRTTELAHRFLDCNSPDVLGQLGHFAFIYRSWGTLAEAVRQGGSVASKERSADKALPAFIKAMDSRARKTAPFLIQKIERQGVEKILDIGGGSGVYSAAFCQAWKDVVSTVFDQPPVTALTREYMRQQGLEGQVDTKDGDLTKDELGECGYDLIFCSAIVHAFPPAINEFIIQNCFKALRSEGRLVIVDFIMDENRIFPAFGAMFALNMLVNTPGGDTYTEEEIRSWMSGAGFTNIRRINTDEESDILIGRKP